MKGHQIIECKIITAFNYVFDIYDKYDAIFRKRNQNSCIDGKIKAAGKYINENSS